MAGGGRDSGSDGGMLAAFRVEDMAGYIGGRMGLGGLW